MSVARRLFLALVPALLAVALSVGLAYWGQYAHVAPTGVVVASAALALISLGVTWINARQLAARIARLAGTTHTGGDELDRIEQVVDRLGDEVSLAHEERARADAHSAARLREHATLLATTVRLALAQLDEVRLPLQILLDAPFGTLNENQEELLRDARAAADTTDEALRRLGQIADADRGALPVQRELVQVNDVVRAVLPVARGLAESLGARLETELEPALARVRADRARLAEALALWLDGTLRAPHDGASIRLTTRRDGASAVLRVSPWTEPSPLVVRLVEAQGGTVQRDGDAIEVRIG